MNHLSDTIVWLTEENTFGYLLEENANAGYIRYTDRSSREGRIEEWIPRDEYFVHTTITMQHEEIDES